MTDPRHDLPRPGPTDGTHLRQIKSYVLRAGRMGPGQERALEALGPRFVLPYDPTLRFNPAAAFGRDAPLILEIGFRHGGGHGPYCPLAARTTTSCAARCTSPASALCSNASASSSSPTSASWPTTRWRCSTHMVTEPASLDGIHIFFPDPWHKLKPPQTPADPTATRRPAGRRGSSPAATCTAPPTGNPTPNRCWRCSGPSRRLANTADASLGSYAPKPVYRPLTKFENRGLKLGHGVWDLVFQQSLNALLPAGRPHRPALHPCKLPAWA
jgi:tRNA (guanine-N7-)-methyltransferase